MLLSVAVRTCSEPDPVLGAPVIKAATTKALE